MPKSFSARRWLITAIVVFLLAIGVFWLQNVLRDNFHVVIPGKVYRSAILSQQDLSRVVASKHIHTILNLTGGHASRKYSEWYFREVDVAKNNNIKLIDVYIPPHGVISRSRLIGLVRIIEKAQMPLLIHCRHGADRTGLASAIAIIINQNYTTDDWRDQVSWKYNALSPTSIGFEIMNAYAKWLKVSKLPDKRATFLRWLQQPGPIPESWGWFFT